MPSPPGAEVQTGFAQERREKTVYQFFLLLACVHGVAAWAGLYLRGRRGLSTAVLITAATVILTFPCFLPSGPPLLRWFATIMAFLIVCKMVDYARYQPPPDSEEPGFRTYLSFLSPFPNLNVTLAPIRRNAPPRLRRAQEPLRMILALAVLGVGWALLRVCVRSELVHTYFVVDHMAKFLIFALVIEAGAQFIYGLERLLGFDLPPILNFAFLARTPAEFWRRYNPRVGAWLYRHVYLPAGGRRRAGLPVLLVFLVSGCVHEYVFDVAHWSLDGYQMAFFLLQCAGVLASPLLNRMARNHGLLGTVAAHTATIAFLLVTSVFFFASCNKVLPGFYAAQPWLP